MANHKRLPVGERLVPDDENCAQRAAPPPRQFPPADADRRPTGRGNATAGMAQPRRSTARTENRGSADRTTAPAPTALPARSAPSARIPSASASDRRAIRLRTDDPGKRRRRDRKGHRRGARDRHGNRKRGERKPPQPTANAKALDRQILEGPSGQHAGDPRVQRNRPPGAGANLICTACAGAHASRLRTPGRQHDARPRPATANADDSKPALPKRTSACALHHRTVPNGRRRCPPKRASMAGRRPRSR